MVSRAHIYNPDVILLDMMPRKDELGAITDIIQEDPNAKKPLYTREPSGS